MKIKNKKILVFLLLTTVIVIGVRYIVTQAWIGRLNGSGGFLPNPEPIGPAFDTPGNISIRIDEVWFRDISDIDEEGELSFHVLAVRKLSPSTKLQHPSDSAPIKVTPNSEVTLDQVSLTLNDVRATETIYLHLLAFDEDSQSFLNDSMTDAAIDGALSYLTDKFKDYPFLPTVNGSPNVAGFFAGVLTGQIADWWREADLIGYYPIRLAPDNSWLVGRTYEEYSDDGNMRVRFSIIDGKTPVGLEVRCEDSIQNDPPEVGIEINAESCGEFIEDAIASIEPVQITVPITTTITETITEYITITPTPLPEPENNNDACDVGVHPELTLAWLYGGGANSGCPVNGAVITLGTYQLFENGLMLYSAIPDSSGNQIFIIKDSGAWKAGQNGQDENYSSTVQTPEGFHETAQLFYDAWMKAGGPDSDLGLAIGQSAPTSMLVQAFENKGGIFAFNGTAYYLAHSYRWVKAGCILTCNASD